MSRLSEIMIERRCSYTEAKRVVEQEAQGSFAAPSGSAWVATTERLPEYGEIVAVANVNRYMSFEPYGCYKAVGVLWGKEMWKPYWSIITETRGLNLDSITHWMPLPAMPNTEVSDPAP